MRLQDFQKFRDVELIQPQRATYTLAGFNLASHTWSGASELRLVYPIGNTQWFSLRYPIYSFGNNFVMAVRYNLSGVVVRYKLWEDDDAVLYCPLYKGEKLAPNSYLEVWSLNSTEALDLAVAVLETSFLVFPPNQGCISCCQNGSQTILLIPSVPLEICNPFCDENGNPVPPGNGGGNGGGEEPPPTPTYPEPVYPDVDLPGMFSIYRGVWIDPGSGTSAEIGVGTPDPSYLSGYGDVITAWAASLWNQFNAMNYGAATSKIIWLYSPANPSSGNLRFNAGLVFRDTNFTRAYNYDWVMAIEYQVP